ncbi:LPS-assembly protein LptD [Granulicella arctica]|uniref:LPS-assembly protein n=1 Tax=Granulicella arctica TaxID=940613 RepID=A0A7Y9PF77_9BACT|nr:LPS-assembly protein [Granulicella arctica]
MIAASHPHLAAQEVTTQAPPAAAVSASGGEAADTLPDGPDAQRFPTAVPLPAKDDGQNAVIESDTQTERNGRYTLDGNVVITYGDRVLHADHIEYDENSGDLTATGHLLATGGENDERIHASHGTANLKEQTARFYDVTGSVGMKTSGSKLVYTSGNPFLFTGKMVVRTGPSEYQVYDGTVTSCQLPRPDWLLSAKRFDVDSEKARARNSVFHLLNLPLLYLPYVTHPVEIGGRQSGILIPDISHSSSKGYILGEEFYWAINRSMDLTAALIYYSLRGWEQSATFRYKGQGYDFATGHYSGLQDRGYTPAGGVYTNQGGEDVTFKARHDLTPQSRVAADVEYLSSYAYREAFSNSFNQAVSSDILSIAYAVKETDGFEASARADRYQGLKQAAIAGVPATPTTAAVAAVPEEQVRIFHVPSLDLNTTDHRIGATPLLWSLESSTSGLKRVQPNFASGGITERLDMHPQIALPLSVGGWNLFSSVAMRETYYSRSRQPPRVGGTGTVELTRDLNRADVEFQAELRPPVIERTFSGTWFNNLFGGADVRHTIEPVATYRYVSGVDNFLNVLRFDDKDIVSNTNEVEYGVTQRLFVRHAPSKACSLKDLETLSHTTPTDEDTKLMSHCSTSERVQWRVTQKYFIDSTFGGAVQNGRRNIFDTTLDLTGIAFLTEPREISPLLSRLRVQTSEKTDVEWDFDYDTGAKKFTADNIFADYHEGKAFAGLSYARLNAPGRFYTDGATSQVSDFSQLRTLLGYGSPTKPGFGLAANAGFDLRQDALQYAALQTSYNWNCCGLSVEYRKFELGSVRNESSYRFNFTLANIGTAGNLRRAEQLF